jgi:hypothetical protein
LEGVTGNDEECKVGKPGRVVIAAVLMLLAFALMVYRYRLMTSGEL